MKLLLKKISTIVQLRKLVIFDDSRMVLFDFFDSSIMLALREETLETGFDRPENKTRDRRLHPDLQNRALFREDKLLR